MRTIFGVWSGDYDQYGPDAFFETEGDAVAYAAAIPGADVQTHVLAGTLDEQNAEDDRRRHAWPYGPTPSRATYYGPDDRRSLGWVSR